MSSRRTFLKRSGIALGSLAAFSAPALAARREVTVKTVNVSLNDPPLSYELKFDTNDVTVVSGNPYNGRYTGWTETLEDTESSTFSIPRDAMIDYVSILPGDAGGALFKSTKAKITTSNNSSATPEGRLELRTTEEEAGDIGYSVNVVGSTSNDGQPNLEWGDGTGSGSLSGMIDYTPNDDDDPVYDTEDSYRITGQVTKASFGPIGPYNVIEMDRLS